MRWWISSTYAINSIQRRSLWLWRIVGAAVFIASLQAALADSSPPAMIVPGQFNVSATGAATYSIPIAMPPGTAGVIPAIGLGYSSQSGDGFVGYGWSVTGLSSISRCPRTLAADNVHGRVNYDSSDRFCLDGQRLVLISGTYGGDGAQYRTELETFSKIVSYGSAGTGPLYFKVWTKSGHVMEYGFTDDSRLVIAVGSTARHWALNKVSDKKGNYFSVAYNCADPNVAGCGSQDIVNGQIYPSRIDYTGNTPAGLNPYNSVRFYYTSRTDITPAYHAGMLQQTTVLLTNIKAYQGSNLVYDYNLQYRNGTSIAHSRLTSVTLCDGANNCLAPTTFGWQGGSGTLSYTSVALDVAITNAVTGDFNGDGLTDIGTLGVYCSAPPPSSVYYGTQTTGLFLRQTYGVCFASPFGRVADFNADGMTDILTARYGYQQIAGFDMYFASTGQSMLSIGSAGPASPTTIHVGDFNGDGRTDFLKNNTSPHYPAYSKGDGTFTAGPQYTDLGYARMYYPADFDGDGCTDLLSQNGLYAITDFCNATRVTVPDLYGTGATYYFGDFNGDGKTDVVRTPSTGTGTLYFSTGTGLLAQSFVVPSNWYNYGVYTGDYNGDGKTDVMLLADGDTNHYTDGAAQIWLSTGSGFVQVATLSTGSGTSKPVIADWNNDGAADIGRNGLYVSNYVPELMTTISNGVGATTAITYDRLNKNETFYTRGSTAAYPIQDINGPIYVVSRVDTADGIGGTYGATYSYTGSKANVRGRGYLGFASVTITDLKTNIVKTTNYRQDFPYAGMVASQTEARAGVTLRSVTNSYADTNLGTGLDGVVRHFVFLTQAVVASNDLDGAALPTVTTTFTYDSYGNTLTSSLTRSDNSSKTATSTYFNDETNWNLGKLASLSVTSVVGGQSLTRQTCFSYESETGVLVKEVIEPQSLSPCVVSSTGIETEYTYDSYGNTLVKTVKPSGAVQRTATATYDGLGQFQLTSCNALTECETLAYDPRFGFVTTQTDPNNLTTTQAYDGFGRPLAQTMPDGTYTRTEYLYCSGVNGGTIGCSSLAATKTRSWLYRSDGTQIGPQTIVEYDALSRVRWTGSQAFSSSDQSNVSTEYDSYGYIYRVSRPVNNVDASAGAFRWTTYSHDALGRVVQVTHPSGRVDTYSYSGLTISESIDSGGKNQTTTTVSNAQGNVFSVMKQGQTTTYLYDPFDHLRQVTDPAGNVTTNTYSIGGNKLTSSDPDMGSWSYTYNSLGQIISQTDAMGQVTTLTYDLVGRLKSRTDQSHYAEWTYGASAASHNIGRITATKSCTTASCSSIIADRAFTFDSIGRPSSNRLTTASTDFVYSQGYDISGRLATVAYPSGFRARYVYTSLGYLSQIVDNNSGTVYWTANARDAEMHLTSQTYGNGVTQSAGYDANTGRLRTLRAGASDTVAAFDYNWDSVGNLTYRSDNLQGIFEWACYDNLNRLTEYATGNGVASCTSSQNHKVVGYDALGNITSKTGVGTYSYPSARLARPHAVSGITGTVNGIVSPQYHYDADGNLDCTYTGSYPTDCAGSGAVRKVRYTAFNMVDSITQGNTSIAFAYDGNGSRVRQSVTVGATTTVTTYLNDAVSGAMSEKVVTNDSSATWHDYMVVDGRIVAEKLSGATSALRYFVTDHLGSVAVVMNESGSVVERSAYDPWGKRRNVDGSDDVTCSLTSQTTRGFTGHEQIDAACLINANARLYDQTLGRFMTADSILPDPYDLQSYNRYSYVRNNPLTMTDPTGHIETVVVVGGAGAGSLGGGVIGSLSNAFGLISIGAGGIGDAAQGRLGDAVLAPITTPEHNSGEPGKPMKPKLVPGDWFKGKLRVKYRNTKDGSTSESVYEVIGQVDKDGNAVVVAIANENTGVTVFNPEVSIKGIATSDTNEAGMARPDGAVGTLDKTKPGQIFTIGGWGKVRIHGLPEDVQAVKSAFEEIDGAPTMRPLQQMKAKSGRILDVWTNQTYENRGQDYWLIVDTAHMVVVTTNQGDYANPLSITIGHELGHAIYGYTHSLQDEMENIRRFEDPLRRDLYGPDYPVRIKY